MEVVDAVHAEGGRERTAGAGVQTARDRKRADEPGWNGAMLLTEGATARGAREIRRHSPLTGKNPTNRASLVRIEKQNWDR